MFGRYVAIGLCVIGLVAFTVVLWTRFSREQGTELPDQQWILCSEPDCQHEWSMDYAKSIDALAANENRGWTCPKCGRVSGHKALQCPHCHRLYYPGDAAGNHCPRCGGQVGEQARGQ